MSPQSIQTSDERLATIQSPNSTRPSNKRAVSSEDNESADEIVADQDLAIIVAYIDRYNNKRHKHNRFITYNIQSTQTIPIDPILLQYENDVILQTADKANGGAESERDHPIDPAMQAPQHMPSRPSLTSIQASSSTLESQNLAVFSPTKEKNYDSQSVYSHTTAQSSYTNYPPGGRVCKDCVTNLKKFFSSWKNHYWPVHCPRVFYYCLWCKGNLVPNEESSAWFWQCKKPKCSAIFKDESEAFVHFTNRNLPCYDRSAVFVRPKPWRDHLQEHLQKDFHDFFNVLADHITCILCDESFTDELQSIKHKCTQTAKWQYHLSTPVNVTCDDHPDLVLGTEDQVNDHFKSQHFGSRQRKNLNGGSTLGDDDSRHDAYSVDGNEYGPNHQKHGNLLPGPLGSEAVYSSQAEAELQPEGIGANPAVLSPEDKLEHELLTMEGDTGSKPQKPKRIISLPPSRTTSLDEDPPFVITNAVTDGGKPSFLIRPNVPP